jgi:hypothetical protein
MTRHPKDILASELMNAGLVDMSFLAADGYYHDFLSPLPDPAVKLAVDLASAGTPPALAILQRHWNGEFDATLKESFVWSESADGMAAFARLKKGAKTMSPSTRTVAKKARANEIYARALRWGA